MNVEYLRNWESGNGLKWFDLRKILDVDSGAYYFLFILKMVDFIIIILLSKWLICLTNGKQINTNYNQRDEEYTCQWGLRK